MMTYHDLGALPVYQTKPQGEDIRYEDLFLDLEAEINKLSSPADRDHFSWQTVLTLSASVLKDHSKDLLAASYLSVALVHLRKNEGLDVAVSVFKDLFDHYWDTLYPSKKRSQGRIAALTWWIEQTEGALNGTSGWVFKHKQARSITDRLQAMEVFLNKHLAGAPSLNGLIRIIEGSLIQEKTSTPPEPDKKKTASDRKQIPESPVEIPLFNTDSPEDAIKQLLPLFQKIKQAATLLRTDKDHNPQAYRWLRFSIWEQVRALPPAVDGLTRIAPPQARILSPLEHLLKQEDYKALVHASESALANPSHIFLLELNLYSWNALSGLGQKYQAARDMVLHETRTFLDRLTGLDQLKFSDGTPFLSEKTKEWLSHHEITSHACNTESVHISGGHEDRIKDEITTIREHLKNKGRLADTVDMLQDKIRTSPSRKDAMLLRLELARILASEKQEKMAAAHLELVLGDLDRHRVDEWDPDVSLMALKAIFRAFKNHGDPQYRGRANDVFVRIVKLSTAHAMSL